MLIVLYVLMSSLICYFIIMDFSEDDDFTIAQLFWTFILTFVPIINLVAVCYLISKMKFLKKVVIKKRI